MKVSVFKGNGEVFIVNQVKKESFITDYFEIQGGRDLDEYDVTEVDLNDATVIEIIPRQPKVAISSTYK